MDIQNNRKLLVDALRSGEYRQTTIMKREFEDGPAYCPLGIACEIFRQNYHGTYVYKWTESNVPPVMYFSACERRPGNKILAKALARPFEVVLDFFGLSHKESDEITRMNDNDNLDFNTIADYIESEKDKDVY